MTKALLDLFAKNRFAPSRFALVKGDADGDADPGDPLEKLGDPDASATLYVYGVIGGWGENDVDAAATVKAVAGLDAKTLHVRINSPGGDVFEARAIKTALEQSPARVVAHVDSLAASAASFLMLAADEIEIAPGAFVMIHNPWGFAVGDSAEMRATAELLDRIGETLISDYAAKTGMKRDAIKSMMAAETWIDADEAVAVGFADRLMTKPVKSAGAKARFDLSAYAHPPSREAQADDLEARAEEARSFHARMLRLISPAPPLS